MQLKLSFFSTPNFCVPIKILRIVAFTVMLLFVTGFAECYKPVTKNQLPDRIKTVAVPPFNRK